MPLRLRRGEYDEGGGLVLLPPRRVVSRQMLGVEVEEVEGGLGACPSVRWRRHEGAKIPAFLSS